MERSKRREEIKVESEWRQGNRTSAWNALWRLLLTEIENLEPHSTEKEHGAEPERKVA